MRQYSEFYGEWSHYYNDWNRQSLINAADWAAEYLDCERQKAHRARGDCQNTLLVLKALAQYDGPREKSPPQLLDFDKDVPF